MADYILDTDVFPDRTFPLNYWPVIGVPPIVIATAASETPRSASDMVPVIADAQGL